MDIADYLDAMATMQSIFESDEEPTSDESLMILSILLCVVSTTLMKYGLTKEDIQKIAGAEFDSVKARWKERNK